MKKNWIKFSDRKPTEADAPYWAAGGLPDPAPNIINHPYGHAESRTHWQRATAPEPPPRELTQREKDADAFFEWLEESDDTSPQTIWHAALAHERAECIKLLPLFMGGVTIPIYCDLSKLYTRLNAK